MAKKLGLLVTLRNFDREVCQIVQLLTDSFDFNVFEFNVSRRIFVNDMLKKI